MRVEANALKNSIANYNEELMKLKRTFQSGWRDELHESYEQYIKELVDINKEINESYRIVSKNVADLNSIKDSKDYLKDVNSLKFELGSIIL